MKVNANKMDKMKYFAVFTMTLLIFVIGLIIGNQIANVKIQSLNEFEEELRTNTMALEVQYDIIRDNPCEIDTTILNEQLNSLGTRIEFMERTQSENDADVTRLKNYYSLLQIRHWLITSKIRNSCNTTFNTVIYFYSEKDKCKNCEKQAYVLTYLRNKMPQLRTYAFDYYLENDAIEVLKDLYHIADDDNLPIMVINGNAAYGFKEADEILDYLELNKDEEYNETEDLSNITDLQRE